MKKLLFLIIIIIICGVGIFVVRSNISYEKYKVKKEQNHVEETSVVEPIENTVWASDYTMNWKLDEDKDSLYEEIVIKVTNTTDKSLERLYFRNMATSVLQYDKKYYATKANKKKQSNIETVKIKGTPVSSIDFQKDKSVFSVPLKEKLKPKETIEILITARTDIPERQDRFSVQKYKRGKIYALSFCYPYLAPFRNGKWNTDPYFDDGETRANEVSNYHVTFTTPKGYLIAATGTHMTDGNVTKVEGENIRDFAVVACNFMKQQSFETSGVKVNNYYLPGKYAKRYCKLTKLVVEDTFKILSEEVGEYPYSQLDIAPCIFGFAFGGMEYPGLCMNNATAYFNKGTITAKEDPISQMEIVSHELAHQWFYAAVGSDEYNEAWLDEGFTSYCEKILYEMKKTKSLKFANTYANPKINLRKYRKEYDEIIESAVKNHKKNYLNISVKNYSEDDFYGVREYESSVEFLCELKLAMGDKNFSTFLKTYYSENKFKFVTSQTVVNTIKSIDNSKKVCNVIEKYIK